MRYCLSIVLVLVFGAVTSHAQQNTDLELARQYYAQGDFDKAAAAFSDLWGQDRDNSYYYQSLYNCYLRLNDYEALEDIAKTMIRRNKQDPSYRIDLGYAYSQDNRLDDADDAYQKALDRIESNQGSVRTVAARFRSYRETDWQIRAYERGGELLGDASQFCYELASAYIEVDEPELAVDRMVDCFDSDRPRMQAIKTLVQRNLDDDDLLDAFETALYDGIQKRGDDLYAELLIWFSSNTGDFRNAFIQAQALDLRNQEDGERLYALARDAEAEEVWDVALDAYRAIIDKGPGSPYFMRAKKAELAVSKEKVLRGIYDESDLITLRDTYRAYIERYGGGPSSFETVLDLAELEAYYLDETDTAIDRLSDLLSGPIRGADRNRVKLALGDLHVLDGNVWEATLLFAQVDKDEKDSPLGEEARFRNARLSYYKSEFEWAQAQLTVLKGSTSELIANDALDLSIFIQDNLALDTTSRPMELFATAELLTLQHRDDQALARLDTILDYFPDHPLHDDVHMEKARIHLANRAPERAESAYLRVITDHGDDILADDARFALGELYETWLDDPERAQEQYKAILTDHGSSVLVVEARKRFRALRGDDLEEPAP